MTNEYEVVPFDKVIQVLNVSSISKLPEEVTENLYPIDLHHLNKHLPDPEYMYPPYGKFGPHSEHVPHGPMVDPGYKMLPPLQKTAKPIYLPSFFSDTNKLLTMFKPPPISPDLNDRHDSANLPSIFYSDFPKPAAAGIFIFSACQVSLKEKYLCSH